jgi:hypothetical protein
MASRADSPHQLWFGPRQSGEQGQTNRSWRQVNHNTIQIAQSGRCTTAKRRDSRRVEREVAPRAADLVHLRDCVVRPHEEQVERARVRPQVVVLARSD